MLDVWFLKRAVKILPYNLCCLFFFSSTLGSRSDLNKSLASLVGIILFCGDHDSIPLNMFFATLFQVLENRL